jgi:hypothetical protein
VISLPTFVRERSYFAAARKRYDGAQAVHLDRSMWAQARLVLIAKLAEAMSRCRDGVGVDQVNAAITHQPAVVVRRESIRKESL